MEPSNLVHVRKNGAFRKEDPPESNQTFKIEKDLFVQWSRRQEVSNSTILGILERSSKDPCFSNSFTIPKDSLNGISRAIHRKIISPEPSKALIVGVLGDSVAADHQGFVSALQSYLTLSPSLKIDVIVRNYAKGATGPQFTYYCNDLRGDEDVVIFENVRPYEAQAVYDLSLSLLLKGLGVILVNWNGILWHRRPASSIYGFKRTSIDLNISLIEISKNFEHVVQCLPQDFDFSGPGTELIHRDEVHPNRVGEVLIATMLGYIFDKSVQWHEDEGTGNRKGMSVGATPTFKAAPICYNRLNCTVGDEGANCMNVIRKNGFQLQSHLNGKSWWEGTAPGHFIEIMLPSTCSSIVLFHNLRSTNGMVKVYIDGSSANSNLPGGLLDGYNEPFGWMPKSRGLLSDVLIGKDLEAGKHTVRLEVQNGTNSDDGTYKFDFTGIACV